MQLNKSYVSIAFRDDVLVAAEFTYSFKKFVLQSYNRKNLPVGIIENGVIRDENKLVEFLSDLVANAWPSAIKARDCVVIINDSQVFHHTFNVSANLDDKELLAVIPIEAENIIPFKRDEIYWDFSVYPNEKDKDKLNVQYSTIMRSTVDSFVSVLGLAVMILGTIKLENEFNKKNKLFLIISAVSLILFCLDKKIVLWESISLLLLYALYVGISIYNHKNKHKNVSKLGFAPLILILSTIGIYFSAEYTIRAVIAISKLLGLGSDIIAASVIAFGTSLPELTVSLTAIKKHNHAMAIGNVVGSNIFNTFVVVGVSGLFSIIPLTAVMATTGLIVMALATFLILLFLRNNKLNRWEGAVFLLIYLVFIIKLFGVL